jgi:hypothetical protein
MDLRENVDRRLELLSALLGEIDDYAARRHTLSAPPFVGLVEHLRGDTLIHDQSSSKPRFAGGVHQDPFAVCDSEERGI